MSDNPQEPKPEDQDSRASECAAVRLWQARIKESKKYFDADFKRMKENMAFTAGFQRPGQKTLNGEEYTANITLRVISEKVASLYARNPTAEWKRRNRLDFMLWDGKSETMQQATMAVAQSQLMGLQPPPPALALLADITHGQQRRDMVERIGKTLQSLYSWEVLEQEPDFKASMKDLVNRTCVCGVAFVRLSFERDYTSSMPSADVQSKVGDRAKRAEHILRKLQDGEKLTKDSAEVQDLTMLLQSLSQSVADGEVGDIAERLVFDFPESNTVIVDKRCRNLTTFDGARWIAQEYIRPLEEINEFFELFGEDEIKPTGEVVTYGENGQEMITKDQQVKDDLQSPLACLWEVFDYRTKSTFFIVDGYKYYVEKPKAVEPTTRRFWPLFGLVFNKIVTVPGMDATCYPPSDVDLLRHPQKEWNRSRQELREHRKANAPMYPTRAGWLTEADKDKLMNGKPNSVIELEGLPPNAEPNKILQPLQHAAIDPSLYDTNPLERDILLTSGAQQANIGPVARTTATESSIAEHSKMSTTSSNVDELDDLLSALAKSGGEMLLREMSLQTVQRIVGEGAVWPEQEREDFINEIYLDTKAASSGRPNKALEISNAQIIHPMLLQAGADPFAIIEDLVKRLDDQLDVSKFMPKGMPGGAPGPQQKPPAPQQRGQKPAQQSGPTQAGRPPMAGRPIGKPPMAPHA